MDYIHYSTERKMTYKELLSSYNLLKEENIKLKKTIKQHETIWKLPTNDLNDITKKLERVKIHNRGNIFT
jgi:hypothetical protein